MKRTCIFLVTFTFCLCLPLVAHSQGKVYRTVSNDAIEQILQGMQIKFRKEERKSKDGSVMLYEYHSGVNTFRLLNYQSDLWLESTYERPMKLEDVNRYNAQAKFSRLVAIEAEKGKTTLSLESQLDCAGGVTDAVVRQFTK
jgi:hypothetical protein